MPESEYGSACTVQAVIEIIKNICTLETFKPPVLITQCGHSFCQECLSSYEKASTWKCPKSQKKQTVPVKSLPRNYAIEQILARVNDFDLCEIHERPKEIRELYRHIDFHEFRDFL